MTRHGGCLVKSPESDKKNKRDYLVVSGEGNHGAMVTGTFLTCIEHGKEGTSELVLSLCGIKLIKRGFDANLIKTK